MGCEPVCYSTSSPASGCDFVYDDRRGTTPKYEAFFQSLEASGKASFFSYPFKYSYKNSVYDGSMRFVWYMPPRKCPTGGCQVLVYLCGLSPETQMGQTLTSLTSDFSRLSLRPACEDDYATLGSIVTAPLLSPSTFPDASPDLVACGPDREEEWDWHLCQRTNYTWYSRNLDVFGDAIVPALKQLLAAHSADVNKNRVHLIGNSMGAVGAMVGAFNHMDFFASVMASSPCISRESGFPDAMWDWLPATRPEAERKKLSRILMFIGEDDNQHDGSATACVQRWSEILAGAEQRGLLSPTDVLEIHYLHDASPATGENRTHGTAFRYAMSELDALLWTDKVPPVMLLGTSSGRHVPGCGLDLRWAPLAILLFLTCARLTWSSGAQGMAVKSLDMKQAPAEIPKPSEQGSTVDVVAGADESRQEEAWEADDRTTLATGHLTMSPRWITSLPDLIASTEGCAFVGCKMGDPPVSHANLRSYLTSPQVASALPEGLRYAISMPAGRELACILLATMHRGTAAPLDPTMTAEELGSIYSQLKINAVICPEDASGDSVRTAAAQLQLPVLQIRPDESREGPFPILSVRETDRTLLEATRPSFSWDSQDVERVVLLLRTSGTTSKGKVVPFGFRRLAFAAQYNASCIGLTDCDVCLSMMPLYHIAGISVNLLPSLHVGATVLLLDRAFEAPAFAAQLERTEFQPTWYFAVPAVHKAVLTEGKMRPQGLQHKLRLIRSAGAALEESLGQELMSFFNVAVTPCYGMTEACEITCPPQDYRLQKGASVGPPMTCTLTIDTSLDPHGRRGEVCVMGDLLMQGYEWHGPSSEDPNKSSWTEDGSLRTGDVGSLDKDGWLTLTGRSKEMINRGGETLSPYEVEDALRTHPNLRHVLAFAAPHTSLGECIAVACVLKAGASPASTSIVSIHQECEVNGLRKVMRPEVVVYCSDASLPKTHTKKYIRVGLAGKLGLSAGMLDSGARSFVLNDSGELVAESADDDTTEVQDSMMQTRQATRMERISHNVTISLYGIVIVNVMLNHWLPHSLQSMATQPWVLQIVHVFRSDKALLGMMFLLGGNSVAMMETRQLLYRSGLVLAIYFLMGWPLWFASTSGIASFHRWFLLYLGFALLLCVVIRCTKVPPWMPLAFLLLGAPLFAAVPDAVGETLAGFTYASLSDSFWAVFLDPSFFWSIAHKMYWLAFFVAGFFYGPKVQTGLWSLPAEQKAKLTSIPCRITALFLACALMYLLVGVSVTHDEKLHESLMDWPRFFILPWYPCYAILEFIHLGLLMLAVGAGNAILQAIGSASLMTFVFHMYLDTGIWDFLSSRTFQDLGRTPVLGSLLQLFIIFAYPVCFGLTVGPFLTWLASQCVGLLSSK